MKSQCIGLSRTGTQCKAYAPDSDKLCYQHKHQLDKVIERLKVVA